jgi:hypothetical protein
MPCESVDVLPDISVGIEEMTERMFNELRGVPDEKSGGNDDKADNGKKKRSKFDMKQNQDINHEE